MKLRENNLRRLDEGTYDVLVVGGGINGAVSAAALASRGVKVALIDRTDFAAVTSQQSSNLVWGGIKYLETYDFGLVAKLCAARNRLLRAYPSSVKEIRFYTTIAKGFRHPLWMLVAGSWLYWVFGRLFTKSPRFLPKSTIAKEQPVIRLDGAAGGFEYSDAYLHDNDARFVFSFVRTAMNYGAVGANYVESLGASREPGGTWVTKARDVLTGREFLIRSTVVVNACGPYADELNARLGVQTSAHHVFSKGIHVVVDRIAGADKVLTFFADDGRLFFVIPMGAKTCIGTTDTRVDRPEVEVTPEDRRFVLENINKRLNLAKPLTEADIIAERCGVRPLAQAPSDGKERDWVRLSRKHIVEVRPEEKAISIFGGKLTDCLNVGEELVEEVRRLGVPLPCPPRRWYGEPGDDVKSEFFFQAERMGLDAHTIPTAHEKLSARLWRRYGADALVVLESIRADPRMGEQLIEGAEYLRAEIDLTARREMITKLEDFLRRRSKISLVVRQDQLRRAKGLREAARIFFGDEADQKVAEYFGDTFPGRATGS